MKSAFLAVALGALVAVNAAENEMNNDEVADLFKHGAEIDWNKYSPEALGMQLNFAEMSAEELQKVVDAFVKLQLISPEEAENFSSFLVDARMRNMLQSVSENWPETMQKIMHDPEYLKFLQNFQTNVDEKALADIVGLKDGLAGAIKGADEQ